MYPGFAGDLVVQSSWESLVGAHKGLDYVGVTCGGGVSTIGGPGWGPQSRHEVKHPI